LYISDLVISDFQGRIYKLKMSGNIKELMSGLPDKKANVITKNYPFSADQFEKTKNKGWRRAIFDWISE